MKTCSICKIEKEISSFYTGDSFCVLCRKEKSKLYYSENKERIQSLHKLYSETNAVKKRIIASAWAKNNRSKRASTWASYYTSKINAFALWADANVIEDIYEAARIKTIETGIQHHVDHIIPLQGKNVSGLHVENNLQIIPAIENFKKREFI